MKRLRKPRFLFVYPLAIGLFVVAHTTEHNLSLGLLVALLGQVLRRRKMQQEDALLYFREEIVQEHEPLWNEHAVKRALLLAALVLRMFGDGVVEVVHRMRTRQAS